MLTVVLVGSALASWSMQACCLAWVLASSVVGHQLHRINCGTLIYSHNDIPRVAFFSVRFFKNPKLIVKGLFPLSDWPLPSYPLPPDLLPYGSTGDARDMALVGAANKAGLGSGSSGMRNSSLRNLCQPCGLRDCWKGSWIQDREPTIKAPPWLPLATG